MPRKRVNRSKKVLGQIPGSIIYTGERAKTKLFLEAFDYTTNNCIEKELNAVEDTFAFKLTDSITWININGLNHVEDIGTLGKHYELHPLVLEDVVSFQESEGDVFDTVRNRIRQAKGRVRNMQADYLLYTLIDAIVDHYFGVIEVLGDKIEDFETEIFSGNIEDGASQKIQDTIMASIFIPLTFIAGIYGMNFEYIPELQYKYSYFILWGVMIVMFLGMLYYFRKKKWL